MSTTVCRVDNLLLAVEIPRIEEEDEEKEILCFYNISY